MTNPSVGFNLHAMPRESRSGRAALLLISTFFVTPIATAQVTTNATAAELVKRGDTARQIGDLDQAIRTYRQAIAKRPGELRYTIKLADTLIEADRIDDAEHLLTLAKKEHPLSVDVRSLLGRVHYERGQWQTAVDLLTPLEDALFPADRTALAAALTKLGRAHDAEKVLNRGVDAFTDSSALHWAWIDSALRQRRFTTASLRCDLAERRLGSSPQLLFRRALALYHSGRAIGKMRVAKREDGRVGQLLPDGLIVGKTRRGNRYRICPKDSAIWCVRTAIDAGLATPATWTLYARCWQEVGDDREAWQMIERFREPLQESDDELVVDLAADVALAGNALEAYAAFRARLAKLRPRDEKQIQLKTLETLAEQYNLRGDATLSAAQLARAVELDAENDDLRLRYGHALWSAGKQQDAIREYHAVLARVPRHRERRKLLERIGTTVGNERPEEQP